MDLHGGYLTWGQHRPTQNVWGSLNFHTIAHAHNIIISWISRKHLSSNSWRQGQWFQEQLNFLPMQFVDCILFKRDALSLAHGNFWSRSCTNEPEMSRWRSRDPAVLNAIRIQLCANMVNQRQTLPSIRIADLHKTSLSARCSLLVECHSCLMASGTRTWSWCITTTFYGGVVGHSLLCVQRPECYFDPTPKPRKQTLEEIQS